MEMWMIWLIAAVIFAIIEIYTPSFFIIWFSVGSVAAAISSIFTDNELIQLSVFVAVSAIFTFSTKKLADKFINKKNSYKTNSDKLIGDIGIVTDTIDPFKNEGRIKISGESWKATSNDGSIIEKDTTVVVEKIDGVTVSKKI